MSKDLTKPFFHNKKKDDIDGFLFNYSRYAKSKNWDDKTKYRMIVMHMPDKTKNEKLYRLRVENFCPNNFSKAKVTALQIESFQKDRKQSNNRNLTMAEEKSYLNDAEVDGITAIMKAPTVNRVKQESISNSKIEKIEMDIKELMKVVKELTSNNSSFGWSHSRSASFTRLQKNIDSHQCFNCQQEGHILHNYSNQITQNLPDQRNEQRDMRTKNVK
ncbi:3993_t:CDS:2 [Dentiscutata erythropus]|uniref:3993_t:CDS:1 n=1 Tax=Dentiscutata erythropus TaxID=1348616 RepID=A0A9N8ZT63_9GLOM|nr:3993_t:CDS:2 [Dentiscutata erythropus]